MEFNATNLSICTSLRYNYNLPNKIINMKPRIIKALIIFSVKISDIAETLMHP